MSFSMFKRYQKTFPLISPPPFFPLGAQKDPHLVCIGLQCI